MTIQRSLKQLLRTGLCLALIATALLGCERRLLEVVENERVRVKIIIDWKVNFMEIYGSSPNGMTLMLWGVNTGDRITETANDNSVSVLLRPDTYRLIIFNDREEEFLPYMRLHQQQSFDDITMRLEHYTSRTDGEDYIYYPDPIGVAVDTFEVTQEMVMQDTTIFVPYDDYIRHGGSREVVSERVFEIPEVAMPMTVTLYIKAKVRPRQSIKAIDATISGMADGFYLSRVDRTRESGTIVLDPDGWEYYTYGTEQDSMGVMYNRTASFGMPYGKELIAERDSADNILSFRITLANDSVQECSFKVGKDMRYITPEGREAQIRYRQDLHDIRLELDLSEVIVAPSLPPTQIGAGFDAKVMEWEDGGTIEVGGF